MHAPTPTDEPLGLPALLLASFPLSPDRRHVAPGPLTDFLVERAADVYAGMLPGLAPGPGLLDLVPGPVGRGELDARLARAIVWRLPDVAFLPAAMGRRGSGRATRCCWRAAPRRWPTGSPRCCPAWSRGRPGTRRSPCSGCDGCRWPSWPTCSPPSTGSRPGGGGCTRRWRAPRPRSWPSSARCRCRWRTAGWCAARAGCCCRAAASIIRTGWRCSGCGWWPPRRRTRCWSGWAGSRRRREPSSRTPPPAPPSPPPTTPRSRPATTTTGPSGSPTRCSDWWRRWTPSRATTRTWPTSRSRATTATGTRRANCCCRARGWPR